MRCPADRHTASMCIPLFRPSLSPTVTGTEYPLTKVTLSATATSGLTVSFASITPTVCTVSGKTASLLHRGELHPACAANRQSRLCRGADCDAAGLCNPSEPDDYLAGDHRDAIRRIATDADGHGQLGTDGRLSSPPRPRSARLLAQRRRCSLRELAFFKPRRPATASMPRLRWCSRVWWCIWLRRRLPSRPIASQTVGANVTLSATANSGLTVAFTSATGSVCTVSGTTATMVATGSCVLHATQAGNTTYAAAPLVSQSITVKAAS